MLRKKTCFNRVIHWFLFYMMLLITGCQCNSDRPDVSNQSLLVNADRFEKDLFGIDGKNASGEIEKLNKKYGDFFNLFAFQITSLGSRDSALMTENFVNFVTDSNFRSVYDDCEKLYENFQGYNEKLTQAFRYYKYYFPEKNVPRVVTMISGFSYPIVCDSTTLGISLDMYLGPAYKFYSTLEPSLPVYLRNRMHGDYMISDAMKGWAQSDYGIDESTASMIDFMVSQGRQIYFLDKVMPDTQDTIKTGYTAKQLDWCVNNEKKIWSFFIENKLLFSIDPNLMNKFVNDGPTTNGLPKESPGNIGQFTGWQIVKSFMKNNPEVSLKQLMEEKDMMKIYNQSKYKPVR